MYGHRGSAGLVRGEMRGVERTRPAVREKEKGTEDKENTEEKETMRQRIPAGCEGVYGRRGGGQAGPSGA